MQEPGSLSVSDEWIADPSGNFVSGGVIHVGFILYSDNEAGQIAVPCFFCTTITEDGTFQQMPDNQLLLANGLNQTTVTFYVKSDLDPASVPEPASLVLFGTALVGFGVMRRRARSLFKSAHDR
jgi:hypothetical protein